MTGIETRVAAELRRALTPRERQVLWMRLQFRAVAEASTLKHAAVSSAVAHRIARQALRKLRAAAIE